MLRLDSTTRAEYDALGPAGDRAALVVAALGSSVTATVYDGEESVRASGSMQAPWASASGARIVVGELDSFLVTDGGVPDADWVLRFEGSGRWVEGSFGLSGSGADFRWSLETFTTGQLGAIGTAEITARGIEPVASDFTASWNVHRSVDASFALSWDLLATAPLVFSGVPDPIQLFRGGTYNLAQHVMGGEPPYTFDHEGYTLPEGVTMTPGGLLSASIEADLGLSGEITVSVSDSEVVVEPPDDPPPPPEPPAPPETIEQGLLADDQFGPRAGTHSHYLNTYWTNYGSGDWLDANGTKQGDVPFTTTTIPGSQAIGTFVNYDMTTLVQKWMSTGFNRGFCLYPSAGSSSSANVYFSGRLSENPPKLTVVTTDGTFELTGMLCGWSQGSLGAHASTMQMQSRKGVRCLGRFDDLLSTVTGTVLSATMRLHLAGKNMTHTMHSEVYEVDPPIVAEPLDFGSPVLGLAAEVGEANLPSHPDVYAAGDFRESNVFATGKSPVATNRTESTSLFNRVAVTRHGADEDDKCIIEFIQDEKNPDTTYMRVGYAPNDVGMGNYGLDLSEPLPGDPQKKADPNAAPLEMYCRIYMMLENDFLDNYEQNIKWGLGWDMRYGRWDSDTIGWTPITGSGQTPGDGTMFVNSGGLAVYKGHSMRMYTGPSCMPHKGPVGWRGLISPMQAISHNPPFHYAGKYSSSSVVGTEESHRLGNQVYGRAVVIKKDKWYCFEQWVKTNTVVGPYDELGNGVGLYDGEVKTWIDGVLVDHHDNFLWRQRHDMGVQGPWIVWYHGGGTPPRQRGHYRMNQIVVAKRYIGPDPDRLP